MQEEFTVTETVRIPEGRHVGAISEITERHYKGDKGEFDYMDIRVILADFEIDGRHPEIIVSYPKSTNDSSGFMKFLSAAHGKKLGAGDKIKISDVIGKKVSFMTANKEKKNGIYAEIMKDTIIHA